MPRLCDFGCIIAEGVPVHRFPNPKKHADRFQQWVFLVGGKLEKPSDYEIFKKKIVCDRHFTDDDKNQNNRLNAMAVPSLYLNDDQVPVHNATQSSNNLSEDNYLQNEQPVKCDQVPTNSATQSADDSNKENVQNDIPDKFSFPSISALRDIISMEHSYTSLHKHTKKEAKKRTKRQPTFAYTEAKSWKAKIRTLRCEISRLRKRVKSFKSEKYALDALLTRNLNQDPVEIFFGNIRSYGARNIAPNSVAFESTFKALLLNNYSTPHSKRANCEADVNECLEDLKFFATQNKQESEVPKENEKIYFDIDQLIENKCEVDAGQRNYVCGWVLTKCLKKIVKSCQCCRDTLLDKHNSNNNNSFVRTKEYTHNKKWLCYASKEIENCFQDLTTKCLKSKNVSRTNIKANIKELGQIFINYPFQCEAHKDKLKYFFIDTTLNLLINSWCRSINRILSGKIKYSGDDEFKIAAANYYNKHKNYKNRK